MSHLFVPDEEQQSTGNCRDHNRAAATIPLALTKTHQRTMGCSSIVVRWKELSGNETHEGGNSEAKKKKNKNDEERKKIQMMVRGCVGSGLVVRLPPSPSQFDTGRRSKLRVAWVPGPPGWPTSRTLGVGLARFFFVVSRDCRSFIN